MKKFILALSAAVLTASTMAPTAFAVPIKPKCPMDADMNMPCPPDEGGEWLQASEPDQMAEFDQFGQVDPDPPAQ